jgi:peptidoglycan/LPS O-acetylase OafA/YrhL
MREPNAIDFWRGFALITIFINHIPGNFFERYTFSQYGISDAAELFVFLAGWSIGLATRGRDGQPEPRLTTVLRLLARTVEVYRAQITIMALALAMIAGCALYLDNPLILEWHNAGGFFADPIQTMVEPSWCVSSTTPTMVWIGSAKKPPALCHSRTASSPTRSRPWSASCCSRTNSVSSTSCRSTWC